MKVNDGIKIFSLISLIFIILLSLCIVTEQSKVLYTKKVQIIDKIIKKEYINKTQPYDYILYTCVDENNNRISIKNGTLIPIIGEIWIVEHVWKFPYLEYDRFKGRFNE